MNEIEKRTQTIAIECAKELNLEIIEVSYVKEYGTNILRVIADTPNGLTVDECSALNEKILDALDKEDFIPDDYYLEVSSPGIEKELKKEEEIIQAIGEYICISLNDKFDNMNEIYGYLDNYDGSYYSISYLVKGRKKKAKIEKSNVNKIRLAVKF